MNWMRRVGAETHLKHAEQRVPSMLHHPGLELTILEAEGKSWSHWATYKVINQPGLTQTRRRSAGLMCEKFSYQDKTLTVCVLHLYSIEMTAAYMRTGVSHKDPVYMTMEFIYCQEFIFWDKILDFPQHIYLHSKIFNYFSWLMEIYAVRICICLQSKVFLYCGLNFWYFRNLAGSFVEGGGNAAWQVSWHLSKKTYLFWEGSKFITISAKSGLHLGERYKVVACTVDLWTLKKFELRMFCARLEFGGGQKYSYISPL